ncbi:MULTISPECIES: SDR family oxidoreductase [Brevibacterium]|nr:MULTISPECIES: SDR family oxidoreductase [Brevibacterium]
MTTNTISEHPFPPFEQRALAGRVALVAGATRGAGRAIAVSLARAGAHVWCTGRSTAGRPSDYGRPETLDGTLALIAEHGGRAEAHVCDHLDPDQVRALVERIDAVHGRLDILVDDIGGEAYMSRGESFWQRDLEAGMRQLRTGLITHVITAHAALPLLTRRPGGLVVDITDGTEEYNGTHFRDSVWLDLTKTAVSRFAFGLGHELRAAGATAVAITPGWLRSELMLEAFSTTEETWWADSLDADRDLPPADFAISESPHLLGRAVTALAADPDRGRFTTRTVSTFALARHYGFSDTDGSRPDSWGYIAAKEKHGRADPEAFR